MKILNKTISKKQVRGLAVKILETMFNLDQLIFDFSQAPYRYWGYEPNSYYRALRKLRINGLIKKKKIGRQSSYELTDKGRTLIHKPQMPKRRTDGLSTIITFDIPEAKSRERQIFRRYLIRHGFTLLQKSVLIGPNKLTDEVIELINELKIKEFITSFDGKVTYLMK